MFQFRRFPAYAYLIQRRLIEYCSIGFPHSEISGSMRMCRSPKLIAACHVLRRFLMPRHSPCALISLTSSAQTALIPFPAPLKTSYLSVAPPLRFEPASLGFKSVWSKTNIGSLKNHAGFRVLVQLNCFYPLTERLLPFRFQVSTIKNFSSVACSVSSILEFHTLFSFQGARPGLS